MIQLRRRDGKTEHFKFSLSLQPLHSQVKIRDVDDIFEEKKESKKERTLKKTNNAFTFIGKIKQVA